MPTESTWICSRHFVTRKKSNNKLAPNFVPSIFQHVSSLDKCKLENDAVEFERRQAMKRRRRTTAALELNSRSHCNVISCRNATVTPTVNHDVGDVESSCVSETCTDEVSETCADEGNTGISSVGLGSIGNLF